jgi:hypothetical protein
MIPVERDREFRFERDRGFRGIATGVNAGSALFWGSYTGRSRSVNLFDTSANVCSDVLAFSIVSRKPL